MIPKIIHYCWFGDKEIGSNEKQYIENWKRLLPDYEFIIWSENNFDITTSCEYVKQAYEQKKWAFVTDYVRLYALKKYGGIYLDTDVELRKPFDKLLDNTVFLGAESKYSVCTATIGAEKNSLFIEELLSLYHNREFIADGKMDATPNSKMIFEYVSKIYGYQFSNNEFEIAGKFKIYPCSYFSPINCYTMKEHITENTFCVHRYAATWKNPKEKTKDKCLVFLARVIGEDGREKIKTFIKGRRHEN